MLQSLRSENSDINGEWYMVQTGCGGLLSTADVLTVPDSAGAVDADPRMSAADAFLCCLPGTELSSYASKDYFLSCSSCWRPPASRTAAGLLRTTWGRTFHGCLMDSICLASQVRFGLV